MAGLTSCITSLILALGVGCNAAAILSPPSCAAAAPALTNLTSVRTAYTPTLAGTPFDVLYAHEEHRAVATTGQSLTILNTTSFPPSILHNIPLNNTGYPIRAALGFTFSDDHKRILVTTDTTGLLILDTAKALAGDASSIVGYIPGNAAAGNTDIEVSAKGDYAFVSQEYGSPATNKEGTVEVYHLHERHNGTVGGNVTGYDALGFEVVGTAFGPHRDRLYATAEQSPNGTYCTIYGGPNSINQTLQEGTINVLDVDKLERHAGNALLSQAYAGHSPVRVLVTRDGKTVWVAARESNALLAFDTRALRKQPARALRAVVPVGTSPIDIAFARDESLILVADSNRFGYTLPTVATAGIAVVDVHEALNGNSSAAVLGSIPTGYFPRSLALSHDGKTMLVALYESETIQAIDVTTIPKVHHH